jgi:Flp pilus assembly protein TadG
MRLVSPEHSNTRRSLGLWRGVRRSRLTNERGQALLETAITLPIVLLVAVAIFEFGRAYQTVQIVTNAAREGARIAILSTSSDAMVQTRVTDYLRTGQLANYSAATVNINRNGTVQVGTGTASASIVTVSYPFSFMVLNPVARLITRNSTMGSAPFTMSSSAAMRNEMP